MFAMGLEFIKPFETGTVIIPILPTAVGVFNSKKHILAK